MANAFNLTAQLNLRGPSNINVVVADIKKQLGSINANVNVTIAPNASKNVTQLNSALQALNQTFKATQTNAASAAAAISQFSAAVGNINIKTYQNNVNAAITSSQQLAKTQGATAKALATSSSEMEEFGRQAGLAVRRFTAFSAVTSVIFGVTNSINKGISSFIDFDKELVKLQQVTGESASGLQSLEKTITSLSTRLGVGSADLLNISSTLAQAGLSARDTEKALKALALSSLAPSFDSMNETVEGSIALMRQFGIQAGDLTKALGSVNAVAAKFAVEASDIISAIQRTGGVFASASKGVSEGTQALNEFIAVFTSVRATTRESAETIATGLRTIFTRVQRESTIDALKEYGVNLTDLDGKFVGAYKAVELLSKGLSSIDPRDLRFSRIVEELGGFRQIGKVIPLIQEFGTAQQALTVAQAGQNSLTADAAKAQLSLANQISKVREEFLALFRDIGNSDTFQTIVRGSLQLVSALIKVADAVKGVLPVLAAIGISKGLDALTKFGSGFLTGVRRGPDNKAGGFSDGGIVHRFAKGGLVPGSGNTDSVPAMLTPGEFVVNKKAVQSIGLSKLRSANRYQRGGTVWSQIDPGSGSKTYGYEFSHLDKGLTPILTRTTGATGAGISNLGIMLPRTMNQLMKSGDSGFLTKAALDQLRRYLKIKNNQALYVPKKDLVTEIQLQTPAELFSSLLAIKMPKGSAPASRLSTTSHLVNEYSKRGWLAQTYDPATSSGARSSKSGSVKGGILDSNLSQPDKLKALKTVLVSSSGSLPQRLTKDSDLHPLATAVGEYAATKWVPELLDIREIEVTGQRARGEGRQSWSTKDLLQDRPSKNARTQSSIAYGYSVGGSVDRLGGGGKPSRKVPFERGVPASPFDIPTTSKLGSDVYDLEKSSGLSKGEFDDSIRYAKTNDFTIDEFKQYLVKRAAEKKAKSGLMMNPETLRQFMLHGTRTPQSTQDQMSLARSLMSDKPDPQYDPKYDNALKRAVGGLIQKFAAGGKSQRNIGYIDYDVIANEANKSVVEKGMKATGMTGPRLYSDHLTQLAVQSRKAGDIGKLRAIYGVAGSGKTTLARGQGTDNAALRQTNRFPILSPEDIQKATEILILTSSISKAKLDDFLGDVDRTYTLSSTTSAEKQKVKDQRISRDTTGVGLEGRLPGTTSGVSTDTAVGEALLSDALGKKSVVLGRTGSGKLRQKRGDELVDVVKKKIAFTWGGFAPTTAGHESIMDAASAMGFDAADFIALVGANEGIKAGDASSYRTAVFDQDFRVLLAKAGFGARGATVLPKPRDFEVPQAFDISEGEGRRKVLIPKKGSRAFVADKTPEQMSKYKDAGYAVTNLERTGGISGTMVRDLILSGNMAKLQEVLSPGVYEIISNNIGRLQNRANILPDIIQQVQSNQESSLSELDRQIEAIGIKRIDSKKVATDPTYAAQAELLTQLREKKKKIQSAGSFEPYKLLAALAQKEPNKYGLDFSTSTQSIKPIRTIASNPQKAAIGGLIQKLMAGGIAESSNQLALSKDSVQDTARINSISQQEAILAHLDQLGGIDGVRRAAGISGGDRRISSILRRNNIKDGRNLEEAESYIDKALSAISQKGRDEQRNIKTSQGKGLLFGAAGILGKPFAPIKKTLSTGLKSPVDVYVTSGTLDPMTALKVESMMGGGIDRTTKKIAKQIMIDQILSQAGLGKTLYLDFDKTLALGADKITSDDPKSPFAAFADRNKVKAGLGGAKLTRLGKSISQLVEQRPDLLPNMRVLTARPQPTLDLIQNWLSGQGLPIPLSQFTGVGGPSVSEAQVAQLKAAALTPGSVFVDDSRQNIRAAKQTSKANKSKVKTFRYGLAPVTDDPNREGTTKGNLFERAIESLGGPKGLRIEKGIDFPLGLQAAAKYFGIRGDIPTDAKRTINGPSTVEDNITSYLKAQGYKTGGIVTVYHGSNTGTNDSTLKSFKEHGAKSDIAQGYGQGAGFYVYSGKEKAKDQARMRVNKGLGSFAVVSGDTAGKPMVLTFKETLDPATWDLDYELTKGPVVEWLVKNYDKIKDKVAPKLTASERLSGIKDIVHKDTDKGIMSSGVRVQSDTGSRLTIYSGTDSNLREGEIIGQIMNRLQSHDSKMVYDFENEFFQSPALASGDWDNLAMKYVGSKPLHPTNIETFAKGGVAKASKPSFGTGTFPFPKRISNAYARDMEAKVKEEVTRLSWDTYPNNERIFIDDQKVQDTFQTQPFDREKFIASFKQRISRDSIVSSLSNFAKFIGLSQDQLSKVLPSHLDFGGKGMSWSAAASFDQTSMGSRGLEKLDLEPYGFTEKDAQDLYGYDKLLEEKQKQLKKVLKTPVKTYDDGSFSYDDNAAKALWADIDDLKRKRAQTSEKHLNATLDIRRARTQTAAQTGRGAINFAARGAFDTGAKNSTFYHELTHQLINSLRTQSSDVFDQYSQRVSSLFEGDNNALAEAFDALPNSGYKSADVVYGRSYKLAQLQSELFAYSRKALEPYAKDFDSQAYSALAQLHSRGDSARKATEFKPINPDINKTLLDKGISQSVLNKMEDNGKEEFLTTLIQNLPTLDSHLQSVLDSSVNDLLSSAGIERQKFATGGVVPGVGNQDTVPATLSVGDFVIRKSSVAKLGAGNLAKMAGYASGGSINDAVPALLTPGEFVFSRKAAEKIGYGKLNTMNQYGRFATGGAVGIQKFATGGTATERLISLKEQQEQKQSEKSQLTEQIKSATGATKILLESKLKDVDNVLNNLAAAIDSTTKEFDNLGSRIDDATKAQAQKQQALSQAEQKLVEELKKRTFAGGKKFEDMSDTEQVAIIKRAKKGKFKDSSGKDEYESQNLDIKSAETEFRQAQDRTATLNRKREKGFGTIQNQQDISEVTLTPKEKAKRQKDDEEYFDYKARKEGASTESYKYGLARQLGKKAYESDSLYTGRRQEMSQELLVRQKSLSGVGATIQQLEGKTSRSGAEETQLADAKSRLAAEAEKIANEMRQLDPTLNMEAVTAASKKMAESLASGKLEDARKTLEEALGDASKDGRAMDIAFHRLAEETGHSVESLKREFGSGAGAKMLERQQFVQSREGQRYGAFAEAAPGFAMGLNKLDQNKFGGFFGKSADFLNGKGGRYSQMFGKMGGVTGLGLGIAAAPGLIQKALGDPTTSQGAAQYAGMQSAASTAGAGLQLAAKSGPAAPFVLAGTAVAALASAFKDARNAFIDFEKNLRSKNIQNALEQTAAGFEALGRDAKDLLAQQEVTRKLTTAGQEADSFNQVDATIPKAFWLNLLDTKSGSKEAVERSKILEKEGSIAYLSSLSMFGGDSQRRAYTASMIPEQAQTNAKAYTDISTQTKQLLQIKGQSGQTFSEVQSSPEYARLAKNIALANVSVQEQILSIENSTAYRTQADREAAKEAIIRAHADREVSQIMAATDRAKAAAELEKTSRSFSMSFKRMFENMEAAIGRSNAQLSKFNNELDASVAAMSGQAKNSSTQFDAVNILKNPRAYSASDVTKANNQAGALFGRDSQIVSSLSGIGDKLETSLLASINKTLQNNPKASDTKVAIDVENAVEKQISGLGLPKDLASQLGREITKAVGDLRKEGNQKIDLDQLMDKIPALKNSIESAKNAQAAASEALQNWQNNLNNYSEAINRAADLEMQAAETRRKANDIIIDGANNLAQALGRDFSADTGTRLRDQRVAGMTGGLTDPRAIKNRISDLETRRQRQQAEVDLSKQSSVGGDKRALQTVINNEKALKLTNNQLRQTQLALKHLAESGDAASRALNAIQEAQRKQQGKVNLIEKLVTSGPEELMNFGKSLNSLQRMSAGQTVNQTAEERRDTLGVLNDITPLLGNSQQANGMKANVLESMLRDSGIGVNTQFQEILNALRNPETDSETQQAIKVYEEAIQVQSQANQALAEINDQLATKIADTTAEAIKNALASVTLKFDETQLQDIAKGVRAVSTVPEAKATGGLIYAAAGNYIDFQPKGTDTVPAMLTPGEFVVNKAATSRNLGALHAINSGKMNYYADGGYVSNLTKPDFVKDDLKVTSKEYPVLDDAPTTTKNLPAYRNLQVLPTYSSPQTFPLSNLIQSGRYVSGKSQSFPASDFIYGANFPISFGGSLHPRDARTGDTATVQLYQGGIDGTPAAPASRSGGESFLDVSNTNSIDKILNKTKKIAQGEYEDYRNKLNDIYGKLPSEMSSDTDSYTINGNQTFFPTPTNLQKVGGPVPRLKIISGGLSTADVQVSNLASSLGDKYFGPFFKPVNSSEHTGQGKLPDYYLSGYNMGLGLDFVAGTINSSPRKSSSVSRLLGVSPNAIDVNTIETQYISNLEKVFAKIKKAFSDIGTDDPNNVSDQDNKVKAFSNKLAELYKGTTVSEVFNKQDYIDLTPFTKKSDSLQVYSTDVVRWKEDYLKDIEQSADASKLEYYGKPGLDRPVEITQDGGLPKPFPWIAGEFEFKESAKKVMQAEVDANKEKLGGKGAMDTSTKYIKLAQPDIDLPYHVSYVQYKIHSGIDPDIGPDEMVHLVQPLQDPLSPFKNLKEIDNQLFVKQPEYDNNEPAATLSTFINSDADINAYFKALKKYGLKDPNTTKLESALIGKKIDIDGKFLVPKQLGVMDNFKETRTAKIGIRIGEYLKEAAKAVDANLTDAVKEKATQKAGLDEKTPEFFNDKQLPGAALALILGSQELFSAGRPYEIPDILGRGWYHPSLGREFKTIYDVDQKLLRLYMGKLSNVFSSKRAVIDSWLKRSPNAGVADLLTQTLMQLDGASKAFKAISDGDTANIATFFGAKDFDIATPQGDPNTTAKAKELFQSLGMNIRLNKAGSEQFTKDQMKQREQELEGVKVNNPKAKSNEVKELDPTTLPKNYKDLYDLAINPYNQFPKRDVRARLLGEFIDAVPNARDPGSNLPLFTQTTGPLFQKALHDLKLWYDGDKNWPGTDYLFEAGTQDILDPATKEPKSYTTRLEELEALNPKQIHSDASLGFKHIGGREKFSTDLPDLEYYRQIETQYRKTGGLIYAAAGQLVNFQPRGTDTVPAMLTPGEFVINRQATQEHLPLLHAINNGEMKGFNKGGVVYLSEGGKPTQAQSATTFAASNVTGAVLNTKLASSVRSGVKGGVATSIGSLVDTGFERYGIDTQGYGGAVGSATDLGVGVAQNVAGVSGTTARVAAAGKTGAAGYGAYVLASLASETADLATGKTKMADYEKRNNEQVHQSYGANVAQNLIAPGKAIYQTGALVSTIGQERADNLKTQTNITKLQDQLTARKNGDKFMKALGLASGGLVYMEEGGEVEAQQQFRKEVLQQEREARAAQKAAIEQQKTAMREARKQFLAQQKEMRQDYYRQREASAQAGKQFQSMRTRLLNEGLSVDQANAMAMEHASREYQFAYTDMKEEAALRRDKTETSVEGADYDPNEDGLISQEERSSADIKRGLLSLPKDIRSKLRRISNPEEREKKLQAMMRPDLYALRERAIKDIEDSRFKELTARAKEKGPSSLNPEETEFLTQQQAKKDAASTQMMVKNARQVIVGAGQLIGQAGTAISGMIQGVIGGSIFGNNKPSKPEDTKTTSYNAEADKMMGLPTTTGNTSKLPDSKKPSDTTPSPSTAPAKDSAQTTQQTQTAVTPPVTDGSKELEDLRQRRKLREAEQIKELKEAGVPDSTIKIMTRGGTGMSTNDIIKWQRDYEASGKRQEVRGIESEIARLKAEEKPGNFFGFGKVDNSAKIKALSKEMITKNNEIDALLEPYQKLTEEQKAQRDKTQAETRASVARNSQDTRTWSERNLGINLGVGYQALGEQVAGGIAAAEMGVDAVRARMGGQSSTNNQVNQILTNKAIANVGAGMEFARNEVPGAALVMDVGEGASNVAIGGVRMAGAGIGAGIGATSNALGYTTFGNTLLEASENEMKRGLVGVATGTGIAARGVLDFGGGAANVLSGGRVGQRGYGTQAFGDAIGAGNQMLDSLYEQKIEHARQAGGDTTAALVMGADAISAMAADFALSGPLTDLGVKPLAGVTKAAGKAAMSGVSRTGSAALRIAQKGAVKISAGAQHVKNKVRAIEHAAGLKAADKARKISGPTQRRVDRLIAKGYSPGDAAEIVMQHRANVHSIAGDRYIENAAARVTGGKAFGRVTATPEHAAQAKVARRARQIAPDKEAGLLRQSEFRQLSDADKANFRLARQLERRGFDPKTVDPHKGALPNDPHNLRPKTNKTNEEALASLRVELEAKQAARQAQIESVSTPKPSMSYRLGRTVGASYDGVKDMLKGMPSMRSGLSSLGTVGQDFVGAGTNLVQRSLSATYNTAAKATKAAGESLSAVQNYANRGLSSIYDTGKQLLGNVSKARKTADNLVPMSAASFSDDATRYMGTLTDVQRQTFQDLASRGTTPEKQAKLLKDLMESAARDNLSFIDDPAKLQSFYADRVRRGMSADKAKSIRGSYDGANKNIYLTSKASKSTAVHELGHYADEITGGWVKKYEDLQEMVGPGLEKFLDGHVYSKITSGLESAYNSQTIRKKPFEFFTVMNQAKSDPATRKLFEQYPEAQQMLDKLWQARGYNRGGIVYANNGTLIEAQQSGTDRVPAMLTPGEFVVNRQAAQRHMPVLNAINSGHYAHGGMVQYLAGGGMVQPRYLAGGSVVNNTANMSSQSGVLNNTSAPKVAMEKPAWVDEFFNKLDQSGTTYNQFASSILQGATTMAAAGQDIKNANPTLTVGGNVNLANANDIIQKSLNGMMPIAESSGQQARQGAAKDMQDHWNKKTDYA